MNYINFTGVTVFVMIIISLKEKWKRKGEKCDGIDL